jgi:hypothetical protein
MIGLLGLGSPARASTIDTYSFSQGGYGGDATVSEYSAALTGTFSGSVGGGGLIGRADLTSLSYSFVIYLEGSAVWTITGSLPDVTIFSFNPTGGPSTLGIAAQTSLAAICVGAPAAFGLCGGTGHLGVDDQIGNYRSPDFWTSQLPQITLVSSVATTPVPAPLPLFLSSIGALGLFGWRRGRSRLRATAA